MEQNRDTIRFIVDQLVSNTGNSALQKSEDGQWAFAQPTVTGFSATRTFQTRDEAIDELVDNLLSRSEAALEASHNDRREMRRTA